MADFRDDDRYCQELIKQVDHDRYLTVLYARAARRPALFALYGFNYEISRIRQTVSEPMVGEIRLQWWREAIDDIYQDIIGPHDILPALAAAIGEYDIGRASLMGLIDGRVPDLYDEPLKNIAGLEEYLGQTAGNLSCLAVYILGQRDIDDLAQRLGMAWGYVGIIRSLAYHSSLKKSYIPLDLKKKYDLPEEVFLIPDQAARIKAPLQELCQQALHHLAYVTAGKARINRDSRSVFLLAALTRSYLKTIKKADYNPFMLAEKADALPRHWHLLTSALFNRI